VILLDTHVVVWLVSDVERLSRTARRTILESREKGDLLAISCITLCEITWLAAKKRIEITTGLEAFLTRLELLFSVLPLTSSVCLQTLKLPAGYPTDPADRLIVATALAEGLTVITADKNIIDSGAVPTVW
jgi:PIN domain nuclease of toxin-antitoxin system